MGVTIIGAPSSGSANNQRPTTVEIKQTWTSAWKIAPDLIFGGGTVTTGNQDVGTVELWRLYGQVKQFFDYAVGTKSPRDLVGYWVRVSVHADQGIEDLFVGRISGEARDVHPNPTKSSGKQIWVAHEPLQVLRRIHVGKSRHMVAVGGGYTEYDIDWIPPMNGRDSRGMLVGNRSSGISTQNGHYSYLYGGTELWTARQYVQYVLDRFVEHRSGGGQVVGATWTLGGQVSLLDGLITTVRFRQGQTVAETLQRLIPRSMGVDWTIIPDVTGFEVRVHAINAVGRTLLGQYLPHNTNTVTIKSTGDGDVTSRVVRSAEHQYARIRVSGRRVVCCLTLEGPGAAQNGNGTLVPKWPTFIEQDYMDGLGASEDTDEGFDAARRQDRFRTIFRSFGAPENWDHQNGAAAPVVSGDGYLANAGTRRWQNTIRETLSFLPLQESIDYSRTPPINFNPAGHEPDFLPPAAWVYDEDKDRYVLAEEVGMSVSVSKTDWGVFLHSSPNHLMALNHWNDAKPTNTDPLYDYDKLVATIAIETDIRLALEVGDPNADPADGVLEIVDESSELWYVAPNTVFGVDHNGELQRTGGGRNTVIRNDNLRLAFVMAGALARHYEGRARAEVRIKGIVPYSELRGHILTVVDQGTTTNQIQSAITSVQYMVGDRPTTVLRTGFAR